MSKPLLWSPTKTSLSRVQVDFVFPLQVPGSNINAVNKYRSNHQRRRPHLHEALFLRNSSVRQQNSSVRRSLKNTADKELLIISVRLHITHNQIARKSDLSTCSKGPF
ncbi:hypothetical protein ACTXT7_016707 [Hymenolepis weldensis]